MKHDGFEWQRKLDQDAPKNALIDKLPLPEHLPHSGPLAALPFAVSNNIAIAGARLTCGSKLLEDYISPYTATAVLSLIQAGAVPVCTANLDEFGMGLTGQFSAYGMPQNPSAPGFCPGGASSGAAALVASGCVPLALCSDGGGCARLPASHCGVIGWKPSYGAYSRYGLTACASSLEQPALIARDISLIKAAHNCLISKMDSGDAISAEASEEFHTAVQFANMRIAIPEFGMFSIQGEIQTGIRQAASCIQHAGGHIFTCAFPDTRLITASFYSIACAEASANLARFTGMLSGKQLNGASWEERFANYRALLGDEAKKRIALGAYVLKEEHYEQYYLRAQAYRKQLIAWFKEIFTHSAFILLPVSSETAKKPGGLTQHSYDLAGALTACSNLAGLPAISLPCGKDKDGKPFGIQMIGQKNKDMELLNAAEAMQNILSKG